MESLELLLDMYRPDAAHYEELWCLLHRGPELPGNEYNTAASMRRHLVEKGFRVQGEVSACGVMAVLENGPGVSVMLRARLDGQPISESTKIKFRSTVEQRDRFDGLEKPVMHARGHDLDIICLMATVDLLARARRHWNGTLVVFFQRVHSRVGQGQRGLGDLVGLLSRDLSARFLARFLARPPDVLIVQRSTPIRAGTVRIPLDAPALWAREQIRITVPLCPMSLDANPHLSPDVFAMMASAGREVKKMVSTWVDRPRSATLQALSTVIDEESGEGYPSLHLVFDGRARNADGMGALREDLVGGIRSACRHAGGVPQMVWQPRDRSTYEGAVWNHPRWAGLVGAALERRLGAPNVSPAGLPMPVIESDDRLIISLMMALGARAVVQFFYGRVDPAVFDKALDEARREVAVKRSISRVGNTRRDAAKRGLGLDSKGGTEEDGKDDEEGEGQEEEDEDALFDTTAFKTRVPFNGSPRNAPAYQEALRAGTDSMALAALAAFYGTDRPLPTRWVASASRRGSGWRGSTKPQSASTLARASEAA